MGPYIKHSAAVAVHASPTYHVIKFFLGVAVLKKDGSKTNLTMSLKTATLSQIYSTSFLPSLFFSSPCLNLLAQKTAT